MSYATIVRKKIRMCERFGHLPPRFGFAFIRARDYGRDYYCRRCGQAVSSMPRGAA